MSNHLLSYSKQLKSIYENKKQNFRVVLIEHAKNKYMLDSMIITLNNNVLFNGKTSSITKIELENIFTTCFEGKIYEATSYAKAKGDASYNGKNRKNQTMTYCKHSTDKTKDLFVQFIYDNLTLILSYQIKNKYQLKYLLNKLCEVYQVRYNNLHEDNEKLYVNKNTIHETISSFLNYNENKINDYMKKYNLKTNNQNDYALALYNAISNKRMTELV